MIPGSIREAIKTRVENGTILNHYNKTKKAKASRVYATTDEVKQNMLQDQLR